MGGILTAKGQINSDFHWKRGGKERWKTSTSILKIMLRADLSPTHKIQIIFLSYTIGVPNSPSCKGKCAEGTGRDS